jgi:hypothetical protein
MKKILSLVFIYALFTSSVFAQSKNIEFDKPKKTEIYPLAFDKQYQNKNQLSCYAYSTFAVTELDTGEKGATNISVRYKSKDMTTEGLCQKDFKGKRVSLSDIDGYFGGVIGKYIFIDSADGFGALYGIAVYDALSGAKVFETEYNGSKGFIIERPDNKISFTYFPPLKFNCMPLQENPTCWQKVLQQNNIDKNVKISHPDCRDEIKRLKKSTKEFNNRNPSKPIKLDYQSEPERFFQITVKARIADLSKPKITYLGGNATCDLTP